MLKIKEKPINIPKLIPFYDAQAEAGTVQMSNMDPVTEPVEWIDAGDWFRDADSAMRVHGDSMFPVYESGSIIAMREVFDKRLIVFGQDYMIQTSEYRVIKRLQKSDIQGCWLLCSINEDTWQKGSLLGRLIHEPFDIEVNDVTKIFRVLGCVKRNESSRIVYTNNKRK
jgi:phage repressor protein C with HTH and peptisase S24 domain